MTKFKQTRSQLEAHLAEQLEFLKVSASSFDAGHLGEAKRMAVTARILLHQTANSQALLAQLGMRRDFVDSAYPYDPENVMAHHGLVGLGLSGDGASYWAWLDGGPVSPRRTKF